MKWFVLLTLVACAPVQPRFPADVQAAVAHDDMRKLETDRFVIYYRAERRDVVDRFLAKADRCARTLSEAAIIRPKHKFVIVMPDAPFNNAFVMPGALGYEEVAVIPTYSTLDFSTQFGLPPDPGYIACHELTHYVHVQQNAGFWARWNDLFGPTYTPQAGYDPWMFEGLATHFEAQLSPGSGRPNWPLFTGLFAAAYAGKHISSGELSAYGRNASVGHHYLVGSMFIDFLAERYGDRPLWSTIANQGHALTGWFFTGTFSAGFGVSFGELMDQFNAWAANKFPVRARPATQRMLTTIGNDARYARGRDGTEAWISLDVDAPARLTIRNAQGATLYNKNLVEVFPGRTLIQAEPLLVSGLSITADGSEVWVTVIDQGETYQVPRTLRWRRDDGDLRELRSDLGPGMTVDPSGRVYYYAFVDGDSWSLAAWDLETRSVRMVRKMEPGTYIAGAQVSPDGKRLAANVWDGHAFVIWILDAATGRTLATEGGRGLPVYDASFTSDGRPMWLGVVNGRFQVVIDGYAISDAPYAAFQPREANGSIRFLDREGWEWELSEIATPPAAQVEPTPATASNGTAMSNGVTTSNVTTGPNGATTPNAATASTFGGAAPGLTLDRPIVHSDEAYSAFDHLFYPSTRAPSIVVGGGFPHLGLILGGADRLDLQRWSLAGYIQPVVQDVGDHNHYGAAAQYTNAMLAPIYITGAASFLDWAENVGDAPTEAEPDPPIIVEDHRTRDASLLIYRTWRQSFTLGIGGIYSDDRARIESQNLAGRARVGGPTVSMQWVSAETTRYTGPRRALSLSSTTSYYPQQLSTFMGDIRDVGGSIGVVLPLPFGRRHTITAVARGRALIAHDDTGLLQVGGDSALGFLWNRSSVSMTPPEFNEQYFPLRFVEPLRGYEDFSITTDQAGLGELSWKYPLIIDRGTAALWFLPAMYLRQLDLEAFAAGAITENPMDHKMDKHYDVGGALSLHIVFLRIPLIVQYQLARRLVDDKALTQFVGIGADI